MNKSGSKKKQTSRETAELQNLDGVERGLDGVLLFADLNAEDRQHLEKRCRWHEFKRNSGVIQKGEENSDVYILVSGAAHVLNYSDKGRVIDYATLGAGTFSVIWRPSTGCPGRLRS